jgi:1-aminocyclopropane-1-carboxylate deaminase/D-cysteine desulfhydrase-like pyridoxal-dependent ACC family enzyme
VDRPEPLFVFGPTPVEAAPRLAVAIGLEPDDLRIKRDDLIGLGGGGNKARKLEVTVGEALRRNASSLITTGAAQSNHARLTAAAGARVGLPVVLVLDGSAPDTARGNVLLDHLFGADVVWSGDRAPEAVVDEYVAARAGTGIHRIPLGGSSPASADAYADAGRELLQQVPDVSHVVVAVGSGGTMAGLVSALGPDRVLGVDCGAVDDARETVGGLLARMRPEDPFDPRRLRIDSDQVGEGYEHLSPRTRAALTLAARTEGILLDPTYTGRALAGLTEHVRSGRIRPGERIVFLHTGGLPGLFGHPQL